MGHGASWVLQWAGVAFITFVGGVLTYICCTRIDWFHDEWSAYYVDDPILVSSLAAIISNIVALPFLLLFNDVSDTILYCFATQSKREAGKPVIVQAYNRACCGRSETDPLRKVEKRLEQTTDVQALLSKVKKDEKKADKAVKKDV